VVVLSLCGVILGIDVMSNTVRGHVRFEFDELATTISLECFNGMPKFFSTCTLNSRKIEKASF